MFAPSLLRSTTLLILCFGVGCTVEDRLVDWDGDGSPDALDCAPEDAAIHPGKDDPPLDGVIADCDGIDGTDADGDGYAASPGPDCDDNTDATNPGAVETPDDTIDQDCDGHDLRCDLDGDGFAGGASAGCAATDCDDTNASCTDLCTDADNDGVFGCAGDCDDDAPLCQGNCIDEDGDGSALCAGDCDDGHSGVRPGATETCDALDNDCNGLSDDGPDADGDGHSACDCDDGDPLARPFSWEDGLGDGLDTSCDGEDGVSAFGPAWTGPDHPLDFAATVLAVPDDDNDADSNDDLIVINNGGDWYDPTPVKLRLLRGQDWPAEDTVSTTLDQQALFSITLPTMARSPAWTLSRGDVDGDGLGDLALTITGDSNDSGALLIWR